MLCALMVGLTGCGDIKQQTPELIPPVAVNESCRPVEKGSIGDIEIRNGVVVPRDYCHFYLTSVKVAEVKVEIGDYVEAGTVVATADTKATTEQIASLSGQKSQNAKKWELQCDIYDQNKNELEYKVKGAEENGDYDQVDALKVQLSVLAENHSYDELFFNHQQRTLDEEIAKQQEIEGDGTLVASHSGYVTYIKDLAESDVVNGAENLVIISDYEDSYIEITDATKSNNGQSIEKVYPVFYTVQGNEKYMLKEYEYLPEELMTAQARSLQPPLRMKFESEGTMPEVGSNVPVFFQKAITNQVLVVGNDSLYEDEQGDFVYVKNGESKEIRYVELGDSDTFYTEVVSGLSEGEMVYYSSDSVLPESYEEYVVEYSDYLLTEDSDFYTIKETSRRKIYSEYEGTIEAVSVTQGQEVNVGETICVIRTNDGSATLAQMYNNIINFKAAHVANVEAFDKSIAEKESEIQAAYIARQEAAKEEEEAGETAPTPEDATPTDVSLPNATPQDAVSTDEIPPVATPGDATLPTATSGDAMEAPEEKVSPYLYEELCCQLEVIKLSKQLEALEYSYNLGVMEQQYNKVSCNNDGNGAVYIYATHSGKVTNLNLKVGKNVEPGDRLFNIEVPSSSLVELRSEDALQINQTVDFVHGDSVYQGKVVGVNGNDGSFYFTHIDNRVYISTNSSNQAARYFVKMDDDKFYGLDKDYVARYPKTAIKNSVVLPGIMVYQEDKVKSGSGTQNYTYVWKVVDGQLVKHYVQCIGGPAGSIHKICVISGLKEGDILAIEVDEDAEE